MEATLISPTNQLSNSLDFYAQLGFKKISDTPVIFSDGKALVEINPDRFTRAGIKLYQPSWKQEIAALKEITAIHKTPEGHLLSDSNGVWIYLVEAESALSFETSEKSFSILGNYAGLSLETTNIERSKKIYESLGFQQVSGSLEQGYLTLMLEGFGIHIMLPMNCPHLFFNPSLTYFNGKENNPKIIQKIRDLNIPITEEITVFNQEGIVDNIIIRDPGGYGFFIFND